jgi:hypothetical protein
MESASAISLSDTWRERIASQQASGQSIRAWCRDNGCREHSFYFWRVRLGLSPAGVRRHRSSSAKPISFAEVTTALRPAAAEPPVASQAGPICLRLARGRELLLPASMPAEQVAGLVGLIEALPRPRESGGPT